MPNVEISVVRRHLVFPNQQKAVEALAPVMPSTVSGVRRGIRSTLSEAKRLQGTPDKLVMGTIGDVTLSTIAEKGRYVVLLETQVEDESGEITMRRREDLMKAVTDRDQTVERAAIIGTAVIQIYPQLKKQPEF